MKGFKGFRIPIYTSGVWTSCMVTRLGYCIVIVIHLL